MTFYVVCSTWTGAPAQTPAEQTRLVAGCSGPAEAEGLAEAEAFGHTLSGRDPDSGAWWASDAGAMHCIEVTREWPGPVVVNLSRQTREDAV